MKVFDYKGINKQVSDGFVLFLMRKGVIHAKTSSVIMSFYISVSIHPVLRS